MRTTAYQRPPAGEPIPEYPGLAGTVVFVLIGLNLVVIVNDLLLESILGIPDHCRWLFVHPLSFLIVACIFYASQPVRGVRRYFAAHPIPWRSAAILPCLILGIWFAKFGLIFFIFQALALLGLNISDITMRLDDKGPLWATLLGSLIIAPVGEELLFRGVLLQGLLQRYPPGAAIGLSAGIFGLMHINPPQIISAAIGGIALGWLFWRFKSLWVVVIAHGCSNMFLYLLAPVLSVCFSPISGNRGWLVVLEPYVDWTGVIRAVLVLALCVMTAGVGALLVKPTYPLFVRTWPKVTDKAETTELATSQNEPLTDYKSRRRTPASAMER